MNDKMKQIEEAFCELRLEMMSASYDDYGREVDQIRVELFPQRYSHDHQYKLNYILQALKKAGDSTLSAKLQSIIGSLGDPQV